MKFLRKLSIPAIAAVVAASLIIAPTTGCSSADVQKAVSLVQAEIPTAIALIGDLAPIIIAFAGPNGGQVSTAVPQINQKLTDLQALCQQYTANPGNDTFSSIVNMVDQLVTEGDTALLDLANVKSSPSQATAMTLLGSLSAVLHIIDGYVQATQSAAQVKATAQRRAVKLQAVHAYWSQQDKKQIESAFNTNFDKLYSQELAIGF
jgi:hypothetical protein